MDTLDLTADVCFFVGNNGTGKSTLLEGIAAAARLPTLTGFHRGASSAQAVAAQLAARLTLVKSKPIRHGFFFRADDVTGFIDRMSADMEDLAGIERELSAIEGEWGRTRAMGMARAQRDALHRTYGENPFAQSHGELFLELFKARITALGLYLMDEPETPLSPGNQIALLMLLQDAVQRGSQFVIASHSPILMAFPGAQILDFDQQPPAVAAWDDLDHVQLTRAFLNHPERYLCHLDDPH
jgi:predicted ATPase